MLHDALMILGIANLISFLSFGYDKFLSKRGKRRISERSLITMSALGGSIGAVAAQYLFCHKTRKFRWLLPFLLMLHLGTAAILWYATADGTFPFLGSAL